MILSDTVGFVSDLPTELVAAFRATLEEVLAADLILHVRDVSHPETERQARDVEGILTDLGTPEGTPRIELWNKVDLIDPEAREALAAQASRREDVAVISAATGEGTDAMLAACAAALGGGGGGGGGGRPARGRRGHAGRRRGPRPRLAARRRRHRRGGAERGRADDPDARSVDPASARRLRGGAEGLGPGHSAGRIVTIPSAPARARSGSSTIGMYSPRRQSSPRSS